MPCSMAPMGSSNLHGWSLSSFHYVVCFVAVSCLTVIVAVACNARLCCVLVGQTKPTHEIITNSSDQNTAVGGDVFFECNIRHQPNDILWLKDGEPLGKFCGSTFCANLFCPLSIYLQSSVWQPFCVMTFFPV